MGVERLEQRLGVLARDARAGRAAGRASRCPPRSASATAAARASPNASAVNARSRPARTARPCSTRAASAGRIARPGAPVAAAGSRPAARAAPRRPRPAPPASAPGSAAGAGAAAGRRRRGGAGSVTVAPATVTCGLVRRTIRRSPAAAETCRRRRSCTSALPPGGTSERSRRTTVAGASAVPWCTVTTLAVAQAVGGRAEHTQPGSRAGRSAAACPAWPRCGRAAPGCARRRRARARRAGRRPPRSTAWSCTCTLRTRASRPPGSSASRSPARDGARPQRAGDHRADAAQRERAVDRQPHRPGRGPAAGRPGAARRAPPAASSRPAPVRDDTSTTWRTGVGPRLEQLLDAEPGQLGQLVVDQVALGQRDHAGGHVQQLEDGRGARGSAASRRRRPRRPAGTGRCPVAPATIVRTNRSWPGTSTTESRRPDGQLERRVAELDRDAARLLLRAAGRCRRRSARRTSAVLPWSMWPAVPRVRG